jgi:hypothetical protein
MNMSIATTRFLLAAVLFGQISFAMEQQLIQFNGEDKAFACFLHLVPELQNNIFDYSDNKTNMQHVNREWNEKKSIGNPDVFTYVQLTDKAMQCILFNAAYLGNHKGVENILKNTNILEKTYRFPNFYMGYLNDSNAVLDLRGIADYNDDKMLLDILDSYKIGKLGPCQDRCLPTPLTMACLAGNSNYVQEFFADAIDINHSLCFVTLFDRVLCFRALCKKQGAYSHIKPLCNKDLLERACQQKSKKTLKELLIMGQNDAEIAQCFNVNAVQTCCLNNYGISKTFLNDFLADVQKDPAL